MNKQAIIAIIIVLILGGLVFWFFSGDSKTEQIFLKEEHDAKTPIIIPRTELYEPTNGMEYTYSFWIYLDDLNHNMGKLKHILTKGYINIENNLVSPAIYLDPHNSNMRFYVFTTGGKEMVLVENIPLHKWTMISLVIKEQTMDVYINDKLEKSVGLIGEVNLAPGDIYITQLGGFGGKMVNLRYFTRGLTPTEIRTIFNKGSVKTSLFKFAITSPEASIKAPVIKDNICAPDYK